MQIAGSKRREWMRQAGEDARQKKGGGGVYLRKAAISRRLRF